MKNNTLPFRNKIGFGTSGFGNVEFRRNLDIQALESALEVGYRIFDTAEKYGVGRCETLLGDAINRSGVAREDLQIVSKVLPENAVSTQTVLDACRRSLDRLKTNYLDVYLLHWRLPTTDIGATIDAFELLREQGLIKHYGVSNFVPNSIEDWKKHEQQRGIQNGASVLQTRYSLKERIADRVLIRNSQEKYDWAVMAHTPLDLGRIFSEHQEKLQPLAEENSCTIAQLCLAWIIRHPNVIAIPKSGVKSRQIENLAAENLALEPGTVMKLNQLFPIPMP